VNESRYKPRSVHGSLPDSMSRRRTIAGVSALSALGFVAGVWAPLFAASDHRLGASDSPRSLNLREIALFNDFCEAIVPGASAESVGRYLDYQLSLPPDECLLFARYLPIAPPYLHFYRQGAVALEAVALRVQGAAATPPSEADWRLLAQGMHGKSIVEWNGPPTELLYFALRNDALDVVYGTDKGLRKLGVPVMHHSPPPPPFDRPGPKEHGSSAENEG
jgi:hypothetical protein